MSDFAHLLYRCILASLPMREHPVVPQKEFKLEAVQLMQKSGKSQAQIARDLGIADSTLHHWCEEFAEAGAQAFPGSGHQQARS